MPLYFSESKTFWNMFDRLRWSTLMVALKRELQNLRLSDRTHYSSIYSPWTDRTIRERKNRAFILMDASVNAGSVGVVRGVHLDGLKGKHYRLIDHRERSCEPAMRLFGNHSGQTIAFEHNGSRWIVSRALPGVPYARWSIRECDHFHILKAVAFSQACAIWCHAGVARRSF